MFVRINKGHFVGVLDFGHAFYRIYGHNGGASADHHAQGALFSVELVGVVKLYMKPRQENAPRIYSTASSRTRFIKESNPFKMPTTIE